MLGSVTQACRTLLSGDGKYGFRFRRVPLILTSFCLAPLGNEKARKFTQACRAALLGDENERKCCLNVSYCTLGRRKVWVSFPRNPIHPYVILPCTFRQRKWAEVLPESVVLHSRAKKMLGSVTQACRILLLGDEKYGFRCRRVPFILTSFCPAPFGNENGLKCRLKVSCRTLGRRKCTEVLPKRAALHPRATESVGFVAEESPSSLRHSVLHLWASIMDRSVTQACRAALSGDENVRKCCLSVPRYTLGRRKVYGFRCRRVPFILTSFCLAPFGNENGLKCCLKVSCCTLGRRIVWVSLPKSPIHPYVILPCTFGHR